MPPSLALSSTAPVTVTQFKYTWQNMFKNNNKHNITHLATMRKIYICKTFLFIK